MSVPLQRLAVLSSVMATSMALVIVSGGSAAIGAPARQADVDWNAVQDAVGRPGTMMNGGVFRIGIPRTGDGEPGPSAGWLRAGLVRGLQAV
jgi:hypothetical protein